MPSNVEIKAVVRDPVQFSERAAELSQSSGALIRQHDTFFNCTQGRLKLRDFMDGTGQLIFYERPDTDGPKLSRYSISPTSDPASLGMVLSDALGVKGEVRKERRLFLVGQTRIHLDSVEGLGHYMELESRSRTGYNLATAALGQADVQWYSGPMQLFQIALSGDKLIPHHACPLRHSTPPSEGAEDPCLLVCPLRPVMGRWCKVVMRPEQTVEEGQQVAHGLMEQLGVSEESLVTGAYMDLILKK